MDVVPRRLYKIAPADGATFDWSVSDTHRTQYRTDFTKPRYAVESWFFGATTFPKEQIPVAW
jgi:hypothetical protein